MPDDLLIIAAACLVLALPGLAGYALVALWNGRRTPARPTWLGWLPAQAEGHPRRPLAA